MNRAETLQEIAEEILIQKISSDSFDITKQAGLFEDLGFGQIASKITSAVKEHVVKEDSPEGYLSALGSILLSGSLFKLHPVLGFAYMAASAFNVDVSGMAKKIYEAVKSALVGGGTLAENEFMSIVKGAAKEEDIVKFAQRYGKNSPTIPFNLSKRQRQATPLIERVFGNLFKGGKYRKASWLAKGIIIWVFKTALLGIGLVTATGVATNVAKKFMGVKSKDPIEMEPVERYKELSMAPASPPPAQERKVDVLEKEVYKKPIQQERIISSVKLTPSGDGEKEFENDHKDNFWIVPILGSVEDTLMAWIEDIYPDLIDSYEYEYIESKIKSSRAFKRMVAKLRSAAKSGPRSLIVPKGFTSRRQVVDKFIYNAAKGLL